MSSKMFHPKHQKLILQCYPPGRSFDKKPNSSELSYFLYYASTRRVKLEKIGKFLERKNDVDVSRNRTGNIQVTLEILKSLIKACPDDLNVFAPNVTTILQSVFKTNDLALFQHAGPVFQTFCETLDGELFSGDYDFVQNFTLLSKAFLNLGKHNDELNTGEWKALSLKAAASIAQCQNISQRKGDDLIKIAIPLVLSELLQDISKESLIRRIQSHVSSVNHELAKSNSQKLNVTKVHDEEAPPSPKEIDLEELAIDALKVYFNTTSATQLTSSTDEVAKFLFEENVDLNWASGLIEMIATWVPVQLRFIVLRVLTSKLDKNGNVNEQLIFLHSITSLLSSSVNLVGLSAIDNLRHFVTLQKFTVLNSTDKKLIDAYSNAIGSLANHIYYQDQIIDIVAELLIKIKETDNADLINVFLNDILSILDISNSHNSVQRTYVPFEIFGDSFHLLGSQDAQTQCTYMDLLIKELTLEYSEKPDFTKPNHNNLISNARNSVLNEFFEQFQSIHEMSDYERFTEILDLLFIRFGVNAYINFVPFFFQMQLQDESEQGEDHLLHDNIAFLTMLIGSRSLNYEFLEDVVLSRIDYRESHNLWKLEEFPSERSHQSPHFLLSKEFLSKVITVNSYPIAGYMEVMFYSHYKYYPDIQETFSDTDDTTPVYSVPPQNPSFTVLVQPPSLSCNDNHSIGSAPMSARSLLTGKLQIPKVHELRKAISGTGLNTKFKNTTPSPKQADIGSLLHELSLDSELDSRGALVRRRY